MSDELVKIDGPEVVEVETVPTRLFVGGPSEIVAKATEVANALAPVVEAKNLFVMINHRKHIRVEGWTLLGSMLGVFPVCVWTKPIEGGWEARVEARTLSGNVVGAAEASCLRTENNWKNRDDYALRSMAQTRATSKALRLPLGFIVILAGYEATPAEEMDSLGKKAPEAQEEDLTPILEASLRQEPGPDDSRHEELLPPLIDDRCEECNGAVGSYVSRKGVSYYQCQFAHDLFLDLMGKGKSKQMAGMMTRPHFYQVVP